MAKRDGGSISADEIIRDASINTTIHVSYDLSDSVKSAVRNLVGIIEETVYGSKLLQYYGTVDELVKRLQNAVMICEEKYNEQNAVEVIKLYDALRARSAGKDISSYFADFDGGYIRVLDMLNNASKSFVSTIDELEKYTFSDLFRVVDCLEQLFLESGEDPKIVDSMFRGVAALRANRQ